MHKSHNQGRAILSCKFECLATYLFRLRTEQVVKLNYDCNISLNETVQLQWINLQT